MKRISCLLSRIEDQEQEAVFDVVVDMGVGIFIVARSQIEEEKRRTNGAVGTKNKRRESSVTFECGLSA